MMKPSIMVQELGSKVRTRLEALLLNLADCANTTPDEPSVLPCDAAYRTVGSLLFCINTPGVESVQVYKDDPTYKYEDWSPWCARVRVLCREKTKYDRVFMWLADVLTAQDDYCEAALQRAEKALVTIAAVHSNTPESLMTWACKDGGIDHPLGGFFPERRQRRLMFRDAVLAERDRESSVSSPRHESMKSAMPRRDRIDPSLLMRPRNPAPVNHHPPKPPPPPPPPDPVLPEDAHTAGRTRLVEVLSHPTNLGLLGLEPKDLSPTMTLRRLRSLINTLRQGCGGTA